MQLQLNKEDKILVIVESPTKKPTIAKILKDGGYKNAMISASVGHIMKLADDKKSWKNTGIWPDQDFKANYKLNEEKAKVVEELKAKVKMADYIFIATDPDREGHVIAWSILKFIKPDLKKCYRMTMHEITAKAVLRALENPIEFNDNMVDAGITRSIIDKLLGYSLSEWARLYIGAKSVGRCQSAGLIILENREKEIQDFKPELFYDLYLNFEKNKTQFKAKYYGTEDNKVEHFKTYAEMENVVKSCLGNKFKIKSIEKKEKKENPKPPFDTPSFQQEASSKLRLKTKDAQSCAQQLFQGIEVNGSHVGLVTYIRTDSTEMAPEFVDELKPYIESTYGKNSFNKPRTGKKNVNAQDGHECLRCTDPSMTPEKLAKYIKNDLLLKVYKLIWQRTIASALPPTTISETTYLIENNGQLFTLVSNEIVDPGYRVVYSYKDDEENEDDTYVKETFKKGEILEKCSLDGQEKSTKPKPRYTEATFNKELQKAGIGRPSTYATIIDTILSESRGYCKLEGKEMVLTDLGRLTATTLTRAFPNLISLQYTNELEHELDLIADGKLQKLIALNNFYNTLTESIANNSEGKINTDGEKICPECGSPLKLRRNRWGQLFYGCSGYPSCHYILKDKK